ncbi:unnamed protein product [Diatraea saccharalis]|uniref:Reverse transcriptase domain-containing protein n=1 Tax=Diatraea saccharalis TaxID=40085 RepID=A0A9N9RCY5_9NEOP|nr:unnamed protein product [Diatraea saccharalis]
MTGRNRKRHRPTLRRNKIPILDIREQLIVWAEYVEELFRDNSRSESWNFVKDVGTGMEIEKCEIWSAIQSSKSGKSPGPDHIQCEILKLLTYDDLDPLTRLFNRVYDTGILPEQWLESTFVTLPKKTPPKSCGAYRTISLMSHLLKIFLKIIHQRVYRKCEEGLSDTMFGFRNGFGTRDALFCIRVLGERCLDMNQDMFVCFIDFEKAFDKVQHDGCYNYSSTRTLILNIYESLATYTGTRQLG